MYKCLSGRIVADTSCGVLVSCFRPIWAGPVIEADSLPLFLGAYRCLSKVRPLVSGLARVYREYDLPQLASTHEAMNRRVARLRKLLRLLDMITCNICGCSVSARSLLFQVSERLGLAVSVLTAVSNEVHRLRDRVHTYIYPYLATALGTLAETPWALFMPVSYGVQLHVLIGVEKTMEPELVIDTPSIMASRHLPMQLLEKLAAAGWAAGSALAEIARRIAERHSRRVNRRPVYSSGNIPWRLLFTTRTHSCKTL